MFYKLLYNFCFVVDVLYNLLKVTKVMYIAVNETPSHSYYTGSYRVSLAIVGSHSVTFYPSGDASEYTPP